MASAEEESYGGRSHNFPPRERGSHRRDNENKDIEGRESGRHGPSHTARRNNENQEREGRGDMEERGGGHHGSSYVDSRNNEKQDRERHTYTADDPCKSGRGKDLHNSPARRVADEDRQRKRNEDGEPRQDVIDASGANRQDAVGAHSQRKQGNVDDASSDHHVKRRDVDNDVDDRTWRRHNVDDASGHHRQRSRDDVSKEYKQRSHGVDDVSGVYIGKSQDVRDVSDDRRQRRERDDHSRKRRDVDDFRRRRNVVDVLDNRNERRRDADDTWDNHGRRDLNVVSGDKSNRSRGVDDVLGDGRRRRDADDVPGDSSRRRRDVDGVLDNHSSQRRRDGDDAFHNRRHHTGGVRDRQQMSPHKSSSHHEKRDTEEDVGGDRFSARFRNADRNEDELPELFSVHRAKVQSVRPFGIFVRLEGFYKQGLVHLSQLSDHEVTDREDSDALKVKAIAAVAGEGDQVWVKVISLKDDGGGGVKIGCSLKFVSQSTGKDLDPNNVKLDQQQPKGTRQEPKKVTLDAIYNVVCSRCGGHGHLKTECYGVANKSYELLPEEDNDLTEQLPEPSQTQMPSGEAGIKPGFGRGRAMVLPAWMTHGSGVNAPQHLGSESEKKKKKRKASELPDKVTTVEEAMALIAQVKKAKKDKHHRKEHKKHKDKKSKKSSNKESSSRKGRG